MQVAASFDLVGSQPRALRRALDKCVNSLGGRIGGGVVFVCGATPRPIEMIADVLREMSLPNPVLVAGGGSVMTERGLHEGVAAFSGMFWQTGHSVAFSVDQNGDSSVADRLAGIVRPIVSRASPTFLFASREMVCSTDIFSSLHEFPVFGGGVLDKYGAAIVSDGAVTQADAVGLALHGVGSSVIRVSTACRLLGQPLPITSVDGTLLLRIGDQSALDLLRDQAAHVVGQRPVVLAIELPSEPGTRPRYMVRGIHGIHEGMKGVMASEPLPVGMRVAFSVLDSAAAATDLETTLSEIKRDMRGSMPRFGFYMDCAGRGSNLYGQPDVDVHVLRRFFPGLPIAGVSLSFEIGPGGQGGQGGQGVSRVSRAAMHLYSGVFCLVYSPS